MLTSPSGGSVRTAGGSRKGFCQGDVYHMNTEKRLFDKRDLGRLAAVVVSAFVYSCGMNTFVRSGNLFPGGFAGVSRLVSLVCADYLHVNVPFGVIYFGLNLIGTFLVRHAAGKKFLFFSILHYTLASLFTSVLKLPVLTDDMLLIGVFGGLVNGAAIGLALRHDASSGGTDFVAIALSAKLNRPTWNYIFAFNACVLALAGYLYGWDRALYSIIFQFVSKEVVGALHERYKITRIHVVTDKGDDICRAVFEICRHGITRLKCRGAYSGKDHELLMIAVNDYQLKAVEECILKTDPHAFLSLSRVDRIIGNYYQVPLE